MTVDNQDSNANTGQTPALEKPRPAAKGFINPRIVKTISFTIVSLSLFFCTVLSILAVWDFITQDDIVWRAFSTMLIVGLASWVFAAINERFGD